MTAPGPVRANHILLSTNGRVRYHRLPQWYDPYAKIAAGIGAVLGLAACDPSTPPSAANAQAQRANPPTLLLPLVSNGKRASQQPPQPAPQEKELADKADKLSSETLYWQNVHKDKPLYGIDRLQTGLQAYRSWVAAEDADPQSKKFEDRIKLSQNLMRIILEEYLASEKQDNAGKVKEAYDLVKNDLSLNDEQKSRLAQLLKKFGIEPGKPPQSPEQDLDAKARAAYQEAVEWPKTHSKDDTFSDARRDRFIEALNYFIEAEKADPASEKYANDIKAARNRAAWVGLKQLGFEKDPAKARQSYENNKQWFEHLNDEEKKELDTILAKYNHFKDPVQPPQPPQPQPADPVELEKKILALLDDQQVIERVKVSDSALNLKRKDGTSYLYTDIPGKATDIGWFNDKSEHIASILLDDATRTVKYNDMRAVLTPEQYRKIEKAVYRFFEMKDLEEPAPPQPQPQPQDKKSSGLILPGDPRLLEELSLASEKSTKEFRNHVSLRTPWLDFLAQYHANKEREKLSNDKITEDGFGAHANAKVWIGELGATFSTSTNERTSHDSSVTTSPGFIITADTETLQDIERSYTALTARAHIGKLAPHLTLYESVDDVNIETITNLFVDNLTDPAGDYTDIIRTDLDFAIKTRGVQAGLRRDWDNLRIWGIGGIERTEVELDDSKIDIYRGDIGVDMWGERNDWAVSAAIGRRWSDDAEELTEYDKFHGYANVAYDLGRGFTAFGSFWRLDHPGGGLGLVFGEGPAVRMLMDYRNALAWEELDLLKHLGPEERKVYVGALHYDFLRGLTADNKLRVLLFGGVRRNEIAGDKEYDWFARGALILPVSEKLTVAVDLLREKVGLEEIIHAGIQLEPINGWRFRVGGGIIEHDGRKHDKAEIMTFGVEKGF
jgi:hypothetical protein